jgi:hypothetical protein
MGVLGALARNGGSYATNAKAMGPISRRRKKGIHEPSTDCSSKEKIKAEQVLSREKQRAPLVVTSPKRNEQKLLLSQARLYSVDTSQVAIMWMYIIFHHTRPLCCSISLSWLLTRTVGLKKKRFRQTYCLQVLTSVSIVFTNLVFYYAQFY